MLKHFYEKATGWLYTYDVGELPVSGVTRDQLRTQPGQLGTDLGGVLDLDHRAPPRQRLGDHEGSGRGEPDPDPAVVERVEHLAVPAVLVLQHEHEPGRHQHRRRYK